MCNSENIASMFLSEGVNNEDVYCLSYLKYNTMIYNHPSKDTCVVKMPSIIVSTVLEQKCVYAIV